jgi:hypothetical protein
MAFESSFEFHEADDAFGIFNESAFLTIEGLEHLKSDEGFKLFSSLNVVGWLARFEASTYPDLLFFATKSLDSPMLLSLGEIGLAPFVTTFTRRSYTL